MQSKQTMTLDNNNNNNNDMHIVLSVLLHSEIEVC